MYLKRRVAFLIFSFIPLFLFSSPFSTQITVSSCAIKANRAKQVCCSQRTEDGTYYKNLDQENWGSVDVPNCDENKTERIECIWRDPSKRPDTQGTRSQDETLTEIEDTFTPICTNYIRAAESECGHAIDIECEDVEDYVTTEAFYCEDLQELADMLSDNNCSMLKKCYGENRTIVDCIDKAIEEKMNETIPPDSMVSDPDDITFTSPSESEKIEESNTPFLPDLTEPYKNNPAVLNALFPYLRIEIPGNFMRYYLANAGIKTAIRKFKETFEDNIKAYGITQEHIGKFMSCDEENLSCSINPIATIDLDILLHDNAIIDDRFEVRAKRHGNGWRIDKLAGGIKDKIWIEYEPFQENSNEGIIDIKPIRYVNVDFKNDTHFQILPLHDPLRKNKDKNGNNYLTKLDNLDKKSSYLDRAHIFVNLNGKVCKDLKQRKISWDKDGYEFGIDKQKNINGSYLTFVQPYFCHCASTTDEANSKNYCIADPYPREVMMEEFSDPANFKTTTFTTRSTSVHRFDVVCDKSPRIIFNDWSKSPYLVPGTTEAFLSDFAASRLNMSNYEKNELIDKVHSHGCNGITVSRMPTNEQKLVTSNSTQSYKGHKLTSATGFAFDTHVNLGKAAIHINDGNFKVKIPYFAKIEEWVKKRYGKSWFGRLIKWILKWVKRIFEATLSAIINVAMDITTTFGSDQITIDFGYQDVLAHAMITPEKVDGSSDTKLSVGIRRIESNYPEVEIDAFHYEFNIPDSCRFDEGGNIITKIKQYIQCNMSMFSELTKLAIQPFKQFILEDIFGIFSKINNTLGDILAGVQMKYVTKLEEGENIAGMMASSVKSIVLKPEYAIPSNAPQGLSNAIETPIFNNICMLNDNAGAACAVARAFIGGNVRGPGTNVVRMGAKTHYRSRQEFGNYQPDINYPNVRYCVGGDFPTGTHDYNFYGTSKTHAKFGTPNGLLQDLTDMHEIDLSYGNGLATDWRNQCAMYTDVQILSRNLWKMTNWSWDRRHVELYTLPSFRTNALINEVFVCQDSESCDLNVDYRDLYECATRDNCDVQEHMKTESAIRFRAELAVCSMLYDIWYRDCPTDNMEVCDNRNVSYRNIADLFQNNQVARGRNLIRRLLNNVCGTNQECSRLVDNVNDISQFAGNCRTMLENNGYEPFTELPPSVIPQEIKEVFTE